MEKQLYKECSILEIDESINEGKQTQINEMLKMTTVGKIFFAGLGAWLIGKASKLKIKGDKSNIDAIAGALLASKEFQDEIRKPGATISSVMQKLKFKQEKGKQFASAFGVDFPF